MSFGSFNSCCNTFRNELSITVILRRETGEKRVFFSDKVFPKFSILDPIVTYTLPKNKYQKVCS
ncbi:MAG: iron-containing alcohol dehydrogenase [Francisella endosymbiont of Hyalomma asiaticum]